MNKKWKNLRRFFSSIFFILITLSISFIVPARLYEHVIGTQLGTAILKFTTGAGEILFSGIIVLTVFIIFMGRSYCSFLCPLGYLQDVFIRLGKIADIKPDWTIQKTSSAKIVRVSLLLITAVAFFAGNGFLAGLLEPFSFYSRIIYPVTALFKSQVWPAGIIFSSSIILFSLFLLILASVKKGRFFCSWLCPSGTILWILSFFSLYRLKINKSICNGCNSCVENCKSGAIDKNWNKIDTALCVGCFNCLYSCSTGSIGLKMRSGQIYGKSFDVKDSVVTQKKIESRRGFLKQMGTGIVFLSLPFNMSLIRNGGKMSWPVKKRQWVFPPGGEDPDRFFTHCTGCMVCAGKCPAKIIYPSAGSLESSPILPVLNFQNGYCTEDCIECILICPAGALRRMSVKEKNATKIANLNLNLDQCIINTDSLECNICSEICPVNAIKMIVQPKGSLAEPVVVQKDCTGCGKCLYRCTAKKKDTIFIFSLADVRLSIL